MARQDLQSLRAEVAKLERNASRKIDRNAARGVALAGSRYDPRGNPATIGRSTRNQLETRASRLRAFNARGTQFVGLGSTGSPAPLSEWRAYQAAGRTVQARAQRRARRFASETVPGLGVSGADYRSQRTNDRFSVLSQDTMDTFMRQPRNIRDLRSLRKLTRSLNERVSGVSLTRAEQTAFNNFREMARQIGNPNITVRVFGGTDSEGERFTAMQPRMMLGIIENSDITANIALEYARATRAEEYGDAEERQAEVITTLDWGRTAYLSNARNEES